MGVLLLNSPKKVLANILLEGLGEEYDGESLLKSSEFGDGAYTCSERKTVISNIENHWGGLGHYAVNSL